MRRRHQLGKTHTRVHRWNRTIRHEKKYHIAMCDLCLHLDVNFAYVDKVARRGVGWWNREMEVQLWGRGSWKRKFGNNSTCLEDKSERNHLVGN